MKNSLAYIPFRVEDTHVQSSQKSSKNCRMLFLTHKMVLK